MKFIKRAVIIIIVVLNLSGCGILTKTQDATTAAENSQTQTAQSQTEQTQTPQSLPQTSSSQTSVTSVKPTQTSSISCTWIGVDQDVLSPYEIKSDDKADGHFHLTVPFNQPAALKSIMIRYSEFGKSFKWSWIYNENLPVQGYVMGVMDNSGNAVLPQGDNGYRVDGLTDFDLYLSELENENGRDTFKFADHQTFDLEINYVTEKNEERQFKYTVRIQSAIGANGGNEADQTVIQ